MKYAINTDFINKHPKDQSVRDQLQAVYQALVTAKAQAIPAQSRTTADSFWIVVRPTHKTALHIEEMEDFLAGTIKAITATSGLDEDLVISTSIGNDWSPQPYPTDKTSFGYLNGIEYAKQRIQARTILAEHHAKQPKAPKEEYSYEIIPATKAHDKLNAPDHWKVALLSIQDAAIQYALQRYSKHPDDSHPIEHHNDCLLKLRKSIFQSLQKFNQEQA